MRKVPRLWSCVNLPRPRLISGVAAAGLGMLAGLLSLGYDQAKADELCGPEELRYPQKIAAEMQQFAPKVTRSGRFVIKEELSGDGSQRLAISFADHGKTNFVHRVSGDPMATATVMRPGKSKNGTPGFTIALVQGRLGACEYSVFVRDATFVVVPR